MDAYQYTFDDRENIVEELQNYLTECQNEVTNILEEVGWTPEHFIRQEDIVSCSFDSSHRMPRKYIDKHEQKCELLFIGYRKEDLDDVITYSQLFSENLPSSTVHMDKETMNRVLRDHHVQNHSLFFAQDKVPLTPDEFAMHLTPSERAAIYAYVVKKAKDEKKLTEQEADQFLSTDLQEIFKQKDLGDKNKPKSYLDYLAAQRDYKRRRQSYRAKNVHITRKSYTEIIREVIDNQTEYLATVRQEETNTIESDEEVTAENIYRRQGSDDVSRRKDDKNRNGDREKDDDSIYKGRDNDDNDELIYTEKEKDGEASNRGRGKDKESVHRGREKVKKKKKKKHKHHKHKHRSYSSSESRSRSRSVSRSRNRSNSRS